jgi:hypothetical protein
VAESVEEKISGNNDVLGENVLIPILLRSALTNVDATHAGTLPVKMDAMVLICGE